MSEPKKTPSLHSKDFCLYTPRGGLTVHAVILQVNPVEKQIILLDENGNTHTEHLERAEKSINVIPMDMLPAKKLIPMLRYANAYEKQCTCEEVMMTNQMYMDSLIEALQL